MKEEKKEVVKIKKKQSIPMTKSAKKLLLICGGILLLIILLLVIGMFVPSFAEFFWFNVRNVFFGIFFKLFQFNPWIGAWHSMFLIALMWIVIIIELFVEVNKKLNFKKKVRIANTLNKVVFILAVIILGPMLIDFSGFNNSKINEKYFNDHVNDVYTQEDIVELANYFKGKMFEHVHSFDRMNGEIVYSQDLTERAVSDLLNISDKYKFLKGMYPNKVGDFSSFERKNNNDGTLGYTKGFGVVVDKSENNVALLNTITHELCHTKGVLRESETEFCAYIANNSSEDTFSKYSSYYNAFYRVVGALGYIDNDLGLDVEESFTNLCLSNEYSEACNFYSKQLEEFVDGTDYYLVRTHRLRNYVDYNNGLMELISNLTRNYDGKIYIDKKEVDLAYITNAIKTGSKEIATIKIEADEDKFNELSNYLVDYQKYMLCFYQMDDDLEDEEYLVGEEALEYYVKPFDEDDYKIIFNGEWFDEYYYERVTRLLLEYHNDIVK